MANETRQMTVAEIEEAIRALQKKREEAMARELEPLKSEIRQIYDTLMQKIEFVRAVEKDYLPPWCGKRLPSDFEAD